MLASSKLPGPAVLGLAIGCAALVAPASGHVRQQDLPEGYQQVLPRGSIPAIDDPTYVPAEEASIRDEAWVLGVVIDGQARAYSLNLLNSHEVVNDAIEGTNFAAVW